MAISRAQMETTIRNYFAACNQADREKNQVILYLSFPLFFVFQPIGIMPPISLYAEC
jgi:hypothetical protein